MIKVTFQIPERTNDMLDELSGARQQSRTTTLRQCVGLAHLLHSLTQGGGRMIVERPGEAPREVVVLE